MLRRTVGAGISLYRPRHPRVFLVPLSLLTSSYTATMASNSTSHTDTDRLQPVFSSTATTETTQSTVIIGAGIIGCATAYYLAHSGNTKADNIHIVEASPELFASASGKAGGFCVSDCKLLQSPSR